MIETNDLLKGIKMNERDTKPELPIHVILGTSDYVKVKMQKCPRAGKLYIRTSVSDFDRLCHVGVLGVKENHLSDHGNAYKKFKQQLERNEGSWYETGPAWTENKVSLNNNKSGSPGRLKSLSKRLEQNPEIFKAYDQVIRDQLLNNVIERASENQSENSK